MEGSLHDGGHAFGNGNAVIAFEFGAERDGLIEAMQDGGEGLVCEFAALMDKSGK